MKLYLDLDNYDYQPERYKYAVEQMMLTLFPEERPEYTPPGGPYTEGGDQRRPLHPAPQPRVDHRPRPGVPAPGDGAGCGPCGERGAGPSAGAGVPHPPARPEDGILPGGHRPAGGRATLGRPHRRQAGEAAHPGHAGGGHGGPGLPGAGAGVPRLPPPGPAGGGVRPGQSGGGPAAGRGTGVPVYRYPLLSHPVRLLLLCLRRRGSGPEAGGPLRGGAAGGGPPHGTGAGTGRAAGPHPVCGGAGLPPPSPHPSWTACWRRRRPIFPWRAAGR